MSYTNLYSAWVEREGDEIVVLGVAQDNNLSPQPTIRKRSRFHAKEFKRFPEIDIEGMRKFVVELCRSIDGGGLREHGVRGPDHAWRRWAHRFASAGAELGEPPAPAELRFCQLPIKLRRVPIEFRHISTGEVLDEETARMIIRAQLRVPFNFVKPGTHNGHMPIADGAIGFEVNGAVCAYSRRKRNRGYQLNFQSTQYISRVAVDVPLPEPPGNIIETYPMHPDSIRPRESFIKNSDGLFLGVVWNEMRIIPAKDLPAPGNNIDLNQSPVSVRDCDLADAIECLRVNTGDPGWFAVPADGHARNATRNSRGMSPASVAPVFSQIEFSSISSDFGICTR